MSLSREAILRCIEWAKADLESAPPDGMLAFILEQVPGNSFGQRIKKDAEVIAVAYAKALQDFNSYR